VRSTKVLACAVSAVVLAAAFARASEKSLSPVERRIVRYVDAHNGEALEQIVRLVDVNSGTMNFEGVREVGRLLRRELDGLGFSTRWIDGAPFGRAGHLIGVRRGDGGGPRILLIGHLDTVFEKDSPFQRFQKRSGGKASGPGATDMKGGDVILLQALKALRAAGALDRLSVTVVYSGDEEKSGEPLSLSRRDLIEAGRSADVAIGFEDGDGRPETAVIARRGAAGWRLRVTGTPAHSSLIFRDEVGAGAIFEASRILDQMYRRLAGEKYLTFNPGVIVGGTEASLDSAQARGTAFGKTNVVAAQASVDGDLRTLSPEQLAGAEERIRAIVATHRPGTSAEIVFDDGYPSMAPTDGNRELLSIFDRGSRDLGFGPVSAADPANLGAADVSFVNAEVRMAIDGLGLMGSGGHTTAETADLATLPMQTKRVALLLYRLSRGAGADRLSR
jgi:glutamate carboxypeptidase